jgi:hypothetical protein
MGGRDLPFISSRSVLLCGAFFTHFHRANHAMPPLRSSNRSTDWLFTSFNVDWTPPADWQRYCDYIVYQLEQAPTTNRPRLQGYVIFKKRRTLSMAQKILHLEGVHMEPKGRYSTREECRAYCTKEESRVSGEVPHEFGLFPGNAAVVDMDQEALGSNPDGGSEILATKSDEKWLKVVEHIESGVSIRELIRLAPGFVCRNLKAVYEVYKFFGPQRSQMTKGVWLYGRSGVGKSTMASRIVEKYGPGYWKPPANKWFDGYYGQPVCVLDDYRPSEEGNDFVFLLRLVDRWPCQVKHGSVHFISKWIVVATPLSSGDLFCSVAPSQMDQLHRRFLYIYNLDNEDEKKACIEELSLFPPPPPPSQEQQQEQQPFLHTRCHSAMPCLP